MVGRENTCGIFLYWGQDLVSYNGKHNTCNGENSGDDHNNSWNCGAEGDTGPSSLTRVSLSLRHRDSPQTLNPKSRECYCLPLGEGHVKHLRQKQMRNFMVALFMSAGTPMILGESLKSLVSDAI